MHGNDGGKTDGGHGEREHWNQLLAAHRPRLRRLVVRRLGDCDGVDDVVQETLLRAYRSRATLDLSQPIGPWLNTIALRVAADAQRRARRDRATALVHVRPSPDDDLAEALDRRAAVEAALQSLSERHRRLLLATAVEGVRRTAIAAHERLDPAAVRAATMRARRRFRKVYTELTEERLPAAVGVLLVRLRGRLQQLEAGFAGRVDAAGCLAGVAFVALVLSLPSSEFVNLGGSRREQQQQPNAEPVLREAHVPRPRSTPEARHRRPATDQISPRRTSVDERGERDDGTRTVDFPTGKARATAAREGESAARIDVQLMPGDSNTWAMLWVPDCDATITTHVACAVVDVIAPHLATEQ